MSWQHDLERVLTLSGADKAFVQRAGRRLSPLEREALEAIVATKGDPRAVAERLGPVALARLRARGITAPQRVREPAQKAWAALKEPLRATWQPAKTMTPQEVAEAFLDRYAARLEALTGEARSLSAAASALARASRAVTSTRRLTETAAQLEQQVSSLPSIVDRCTHPDAERETWRSRAGELGREALDTAELVRALRTTTTALTTQCRELQQAIDEWANAPEIERAERAEAMGTRVRAATDAVSSMRDELVGVLLARI